MIYPVSIKSTQPDNILEVRWGVNNICNFSCRYCFPDANARTHPTIDNIELLVNNFNHLFDQYKRKLDKTDFHLFITGGEPTLWKNFGTFLKEIKKDNIYISVVSNASRSLRWWNAYGKFIDNAVLSFHIKDVNIDHHIAVADTLHEQGKKVTVPVLMDPDRWDDCISAIDYMKNNSKHSWFIEAKPVVDTELVKIKYNNSQLIYLEKELKRLPNLFWFSKNIKLLTNYNIRDPRSIATLDNGKKLQAGNSTYINKGYTNFRGWNCNINQEAIYVGWNGDIKGSCGQILFGKTKSYNILNDDFIKQDLPINISSICSIDNCTCQPDTHVTKYKL
jgi:organic radical activating enzyme